MKKVMIVDDDSVSRTLLARVMKPYAKDFEVLTAENGKEAANLMTRKTIDLIVSDLEMPEMDGFELLQYIHQNYPGTPVFIMTAFGSDEIKKRTTDLGALKYFEKPLNMDILTDSIYEQLNSRADGKLSGIGLASLLQLLEMEKNTCTLTISSDGKSGTMYLQTGELIDAATDKLKGLKAALELISWDKIQIGIEGICRKRQKEIKQPLMTILMEGLKIKDEKETVKRGSKPALRPLTDFSSKRSARQLK